MKSILLSALVIVAITTGTAVMPLVGDANISAEPLESLFIPFVTAIIAIQLVPAVLLLGGLLKAIFADNVNEQEDELYDENC